MTKGLFKGLSLCLEDSITLINLMIYNQIRIEAILHFRIELLLGLFTVFRLTTKKHK